MKFAIGLVESGRAVSFSAGIVLLWQLAIDSIERKLALVVDDDWRFYADDRRYAHEFGGYNHSKKSMPKLDHCCFFVC